MSENMIKYAAGFVLGLAVSVIYAILRLNTMALDYFFTGKC